MAEVTRANFETLLPEIEKRLRSCNFVCMDAEYTGIHSEEINDRNSLFDTPEKRYNKLRANVAGKFVICQIGLAFYERCVDDDREWLCNGYNVFVFPVSFDAFAKRDVVTLQVSCMNFLSTNAFDFNKFIREGVPYLNQGKTDNLKRWLISNRHFMSTCEHLDPTYFPKRIEYLNDQDINDIVERLKGFSKVVHLLTKYRKTLIGHNMLMDIMLMYNQFIGDLPASYKQFKENVNSLFPSIFDTKCIAYGLSSLRLKDDPDDRVLSDTNLFALYTNCSTVLQNASIRPVITVQNETKLYGKALYQGVSKNLQTVEDAKCHTAVFDAIITGAVLMKLGYIAARPKMQGHQVQPPTITEIFKRLLKWKSEVNICRCIAHSVNFSGDDPMSDRPDWIRVRSRQEVDPFKLRGQLVKYGDMEIEAVSSSEVIIACSGFGCYRRVLADLKGKGFQLSNIKIPNPALRDPLWRKAMQYGAVISISSLISIWLYYRRRM